MGQKWPKKKYGKALGKFKFLLPALEKQTADYLLITDSYDIIINETPKTTLELYKKYDNKIIFGQDKCFYLNSFFPNISKINGKFINMGSVLGPRDMVIKYYKDLLEYKKYCNKISCSDQELSKKMINDRNMWDINKNIIIDDDLMFYIYYPGGYKSKNIKYNKKDNKFHIKNKIPILIHVVATNKNSPSEYWYLSLAGYNHFKKIFYGEKCKNKDCPICGNYWLYTILKKTPIVVWVFKKYIYR